MASLLPVTYDLRQVIVTPAEAAHSSEMSVSAHRTAQCHNPGNHKMHKPHLENLKKLVTDCNQLLCVSKTSEHRFSLDRDVQLYIIKKFLDSIFSIK
jgi:hypothetical protein